MLQFCIQKNIASIVDIRRYQLSISTSGIFLDIAGTLTSGPAAFRAAPHACMHAMQSLHLHVSHREQQAQHEFLISLHRRQIFFLVLHNFIPLFNSARLLTLSSWISRCVRRQHTVCICTVQRMSLSQHIRVLRSEIFYRY